MLFFSYLMFGGFYSDVFSGSCYRCFNIKLFSVYYYKILLVLVGIYRLFVSNYKWVYFCYWII